MLGENRLDAADYQGAIRAFAESLEVNPQSAAAHFELGWLYDQKVSDPAAAIYHYERYLKLKPDASNAAMVEQRIEACKRKLAVAVFSLPSTAAQQRRLQALVAQHQRLQDEILRLRAIVSGWSAFYENRLAARTNAPLVVSTPAVMSHTARSDPARWAEAPQISRSVTRYPPTARRRRLHVVVAGDTAYRIARHCGVSLHALLAANPGLEPRQMAVGQVLNIPPSDALHDSGLQYK